jgi:hypothetical protein
MWRAQVFAQCSHIIQCCTLECCYFLAFV